MLLMKILADAFMSPNQDEVRFSVSNFARMMEKVLRDNDHKGGWDECAPLWLFAKLGEEVGEVGEALTDLYTTKGEQETLMSLETIGLKNAIEECVDVANVAMMIAYTLAMEFASEDTP